MEGDFSQLSSVRLLRMGLIVEFDEPTHEGHPLDRTYSPSFELYKECQTVKSAIETKHSAILAIPPTVEYDSANLNTDGRRWHPSGYAHPTR